MTKQAIHGLILAGGSSSRMGTDKSRINYHGHEQREFLAELLGKFCSKVFISCKVGQEIPDYLNALHDQLDLQSPLNGIVSAFRSNSDCAWLIVAVDMPLVDEQVIAYLIRNRDESVVATCYMDSVGEMPEPLLSIWEPKVSSKLESFISSGGVSPRQFLIDNHCKTIKIDDASKLTNINTSKDLLNFRIQQQNLHKKRQD